MRLRDLILFPAGGIRYLLRDEFNDTLAAGSVNNTPATPGPGTRTVVDTGLTLSISGGQLLLGARTAAGDPGLWYGAVTRTAGRLLMWQYQRDVGARVQMGFDSNQSGEIIVTNFDFDAANVLALADFPVSSLPVGLWAVSTIYSSVIVLRAAGAYYFIKGGLFTNWTLLWAGSQEATATLYPGISERSTGGTITIDRCRIPDVLWLPTPIAYDTFTRANGALGTSEATGPDGQAATARTWTFDAGIWTVATNQAQGSPVLGGDVIVNGAFAADSDWDKGTGWTIGAGVATKTAGTASDLSQTVAPLTAGVWYNLAYDVTRTAGSITPKFGTQAGVARSTSASFTETGRANGTAFALTGDAAYAGTVDNVVVKPLTLTELFANVDDVQTSGVVISADVTVTAGTQAGVVMNLDSAAAPANFVIAYHDGTNAKLDKCVAGVYTSVISAAATYSAGATLRVVKDGTSYSLYYNNAKVGTTQTISDAGIISNTKHGLFSTYSVNRLDNFTVFPRGTGNEYSKLDQY